MHKFIANSMKFDYRNHPKFSFISAQLTDTHNPESHDKLKSDLESHGYKPVEVLGHYGNTEKSFFVPHSGSEQDKTNIEKLGNKYNQESVLHSVNGQNHLVHLKDPNKSLFGQGSSNDFSDNYFTEFPNGQKMKLHLGNIESLKKSEDDVLYHYSKVKGLKTIDPNFHGTGMAGEERKRGLIIPRTYYYDTPSDHERRVSAPAQSMYTVKKPEKILDIASDEAKPLIEKARNDYGNVDLSELEGHIKDAGYHGYKNSSSSLPNAVAIFHPMPVHSEKMTKNENLGILNSGHIEQLQKETPQKPNTEYLKVYHGGHPDNLKSLERNFKILSPEEKLELPSTGSGKIGLSTSTNPKISKNYSQAFGHNKVSTFYLHPDAKVLKVNTNGKGIDEHFSNEQIKDLQNKGFDAIHDTDPSENSEFEVRILKPDHVLNERQKFIREQQDGKKVEEKRLPAINKSEGLYHLVQAKDYLCKNECFCALHHAKKALDLGYDCENIFEEARRNLRMEKNMAIELLEKGEITNALKALGFAGALATGAYHYSTPEKTPAFNAPVQQQIVIPQVSKEQIIKDKTLRAISKVESNNNPNAIHRQMSSSGLHQGSRAIGSYGLMPVTIKEMVKKNPDLNKKYGHILNTHGELFRSLIQKNPETEHEIASKLYDNLAKKFGHNPERIGHAWFNGVNGTIKSLQENKDLGKHWHVKKIMKEYNSLK